MAYAKRYAGGFFDNAGGATPIDSTFLNAVEAALLKLFGVDASADGQALLWSLANSRYQPALIGNANIDPAAAIAKSKLAALNITDADVAAAAGIAASKLGGNIPASKLAGYPGSEAKGLWGDGSWLSGAKLLYDSSDAGAVLPAASITTPSLSQNFAHLMIVWKVRTAAAVASSNFGVRINGLTTATYYDERVSGTAAAATTNEVLAGTSARMGLIAGGSSANGADFGVGITLFPQYTDATTFKSFVTVGYATAGTATGLNTVFMSGGYNNTAAAALTTLTFLDQSAGNLMAGSRISIYGLGSV